MRISLLELAIKHTKYLNLNIRYKLLIETYSNKCMRSIYIKTVCCLPEIYILVSVFHSTGNTYGREIESYLESTKESCVDCWVNTFCSMGRHKYRHLDFGCGRKITILGCEWSELVLSSQLWLEKQNLLNKM